MANRHYRTYWMTGLMLFILLGCVTINIYFPAEEVESVAGEIVDDVRKDETRQQEGESLDPDQSSLSGKIFLAFVASPAFAAEDAVKVSNPTIRSLKAGMKKRFQQLKPYFRKGILAEGDDGYLVLKNDQDLSLKEKRDLKSLVEAENRDRKRLYTEVAKALDIEPSQIKEVARIFADKWQETVP
ncbi:MAG: YdbL family protein [Desulfohalobiaceae bacterium]|nr:YdbL family protein [Desulfohalobiaceae bacterium]